jgi:thiol-disulfide isomerase/thioredoxin
LVMKCQITFCLETWQVGNLWYNNGGEEMQEEIKESLKKFGRLILVGIIVVVAIALAIGFNIRPVQTEAPQEVNDDGPLTLLYFYNDTWPHCRKAKVVVDELEKEYAGFAKVERWNLGSVIGMKVAEDYDVHGVPTLVLIDSANQVLGRWVGFPPQEKIEQLLDWLKSTYKPEVWRSKMEQKKVGQAEKKNHTDEIEDKALWELSNASSQSLRAMAWAIFYFARVIRERNRGNP